MTCHLLRLPRELRDEIWKFALSEPNGLFYRRVDDDKSFKLYTTPTPSTEDEDLDTDAAANREANQLKYVCRQLYTETAGLGLKLNDLTFSRYEPRGTNVPPETNVELGVFVKACSYRNLRGIKVITIKAEAVLPSRGTPHRGVPEWKPLLQFCREHPRITVNFHPSFLQASVTHGRQLRHAMAAVFCTRSDNQSVAFPKTTTLPTAAVYFPIWNSESPQPENIPNLRWFPLDSKFDEQSYRSGLAGCLFHTASEIDALVDDIKGWYEHGF
ncbi:hypothetical protein BCR34DRAFT_584698 [Clohesyomyces aquaticus]|uniref:Uncharacterized protein n=1 Tax=Clohesyomyces aquaticus TaxID=1231657 RepID=A0A1Y2A0H8_9PLEO|nr:hypothetical protein BCR34DRAFT_584698 [Clohesyomyces aquaticus]